MKTDKTSAASSLEISLSWCSETAKISTLVEFVIQNIDPEYISHGEIQAGRALDTHTWSPDLHDILAQEFSSSMDPQPETRDQLLTATAYQSGELVGLMLVEIHRKASLQYAVLSDLVVLRSRRGLGIGRDCLLWLDSQLVQMGVSKIFLESGINNKRAHTFFTAFGFEPCSLVMQKDIGQVPGSDGD